MANSAYFIVDLRVTDAEGMKPYLERVAETVAAYGGKPIVAGGQIDPLEGNAPQGKIFIVEFNSMEQARAWYHSPGYQEIVGYRLAAAQCHGYLIEGVDQ